MRTGPYLAKDVLLPLRGQRTARPLDLHQDLIEWAHSDTSDGPSSYVSLISFFIEKNRILYGHALLDMTPGSFGQLFSDVLYYLIDGRVGAFLRGEYGR